MTGLKIGDGTAPPGFPAYRGCEWQGAPGVECRFNGCGHKGTHDVPAQMECGGRTCDCPCCRMLAGNVEFGCSYGRHA